MGMRIGGSGAGQVGSMATWQQRQQMFQQLTSALQAGNLSSAQQAFSSLTGGKPVQGNGPLAQVGQALQNGDLSGAQKALQALQSNHGKHHHHHGGQSIAPPAAQPSSSSNTPGTGTLINVTV